MADQEITEKTGFTASSLLGENAGNTDLAWFAVFNALTETLAGKVLDARQGKVLKDLIDTNTASIVTNSANIATNTTNITSNTSAISSLQSTSFNKSVDDTDDITVGSTNKFATAAEKTKLGHISITQAVDLDDIESRVNNLDAAVVLKGSWDASAGSFPGGGTAQAGASYIVSVAGTVDGVAFNIGDRVIAITDNASTSTFASNWFKADYTDQVLSVNGQTGAVTIGIAQISGLQTALDGKAPTNLAGSPVEIQIALSDLITALTTGTNKAYFRAPFAFTLQSVRASVLTAPTGSTLIVDINESGSTILSTKLSIDASEKTSTTAASAAVISDSAIADDAELTFDIDQVGSSVAGAGLIVTLKGVRV